MTLDNIPEKKAVAGNSKTTTYSVKETPGSLIASDEFLDKNLPLEEMPQFFSFQSEEIRFGLQALSKWSEKSGGKETAGVIYNDTSPQKRFKDIAIGTDTEVNFITYDLSQLTTEQAHERMLEFDRYSKNRGHQIFVLLPEDYSYPQINNEKITTAKGKKVLGSEHIHPSGNPPNGHDLAIFMYDRTDSINGVVAGETNYLMVASKDTPNYETKPTKNNRSTTMHDFGNEIDRETVLLIQSGKPDQIAIRETLIKHCRLNKVALFEGYINSNVYRKLT